MKRIGYGRDALVVFVLLAFIYGYFYQDAGGNGNSRFGLIFALVREHRLTIDSFHDQPDTQTDDKAFYNGHYYSDKDIGTAVLGTLVYWPLYTLARLLHIPLSLAATKYILMLAVVALPSAFAGSLMYVLAKTILGSALHALAATLTITLGTIYFPYSTSFFGHALAGALLFTGFFLIYQLKVQPELYQTGYVYLVGLILGLALIADYTAALVVGALGLYYLFVVWTRHTPRSLRAISPYAVVLPILGAAIPLAILLIYNLACFGNAFSIGYQHLSDPVFREGMSRGIGGVTAPSPKVLYYLTLNPGIGLFWQSPVLLVALAGFYWMFRDRRFRIEAALALFAFISYLVLNSGYYMWWGGYAAGPRIIVPMLPFLLLPLLFVPARLIGLVVALGVISIAQMLIIAASLVLVPDVDTMKQIGQFSYFQYSAIYSYCLKQLQQGNFAPNAGQLINLKGWLSLLPLLLGVGLGLELFVAACPARPKPEPAA